MLYKWEHQSGLAANWIWEDLSCETFGRTRPIWWRATKGTEFVRTSIRDAGGYLVIGPSPM
ncbi:3805_t:CDS:2, partial [Scutellospora calospora]